jgi:cytochrome c peroxidase
LELFQSKASCADCHSVPNFTDEKYHNLGVGTDQSEPDLGRFAVTQKEEDKGAFKTPTLRDIALTVPYFHDGSASTLEAVIERYNQGGTENPNLSPLVKPLKLTEEEENDLVEFLRSLTGEIPVEVLAPELPK